ncbi:MAG TPA: peptidoglycan-binding domain-containing protein [Bryobacteraceae bacterium]|nr:peptidoglycan-binding domain-containing protein [Bryobacteraceae bacterium]
MKFVSFVLFLAVFGVTLSIGSAQTSSSTKKSSGKSAPSKAVSGKAGTTKTGARSSSAGSRANSGKKPVRRVAAGPPRQAAPTPERYKEIQQALADKGYLKTAPSGVWDAQSMEAMRQYQTDRKLEPSGKLTAAALIDLGLGPRNETHPVAATPPAQVPDPPKIETAPQP